MFPRYLERAEPAGAFSPDGGLDWLDGLDSERLEPGFSAGNASVTYRPGRPGSYIARWRTGDRVLYRYFAAIEDDWTVVRFSPFVDPEPEPTLHATGIPLDYSLPVEQFHAGSPRYEKLLAYHRQFGDSMAPAFPDTPDVSVDVRVREYGWELSRVRGLLPDPSDARSARVWMRHELDPGYTPAFEQLGINDHFGLSNANAKPYLGMPEFPYFASPLDIRKTNQSEGGAVVAHQWDFCGGWHFLGPVSWHYLVSEGRWESAVKCLLQGMREAVVQHPSGRAVHRMRQGGASPTVRRAISASDGLRAPQAAQGRLLEVYRHCGLLPQTLLHDAEDRLRQQD